MSPPQDPANPAASASGSRPDPVVGRPSPLTVARRRELQQRFERAWSGLRDGSASVDDVHAWIAPCVVEDPASALYVDTLLLNLRRTDGSKKERWLVRGWRQTKLAAAALRQQWREVLATGPDVLRCDASHPPTLWSLVDAAHASGYRESAWRYAEEALRVASESPETWRRCARTLAARGQFALAISFWKRVAAAQPHDSETQRILPVLSPRPAAGHAQRLAPAATGMATAIARPETTTSAADFSPDVPRGSGSGIRPAGSATGSATGSVMGSAMGSAMGLVTGSVAGSTTEPGTMEECLWHLEVLRRVAAWEDAERLLQWAASRWGRDLRLEEAGEDIVCGRHAEQAAQAERLAAVDADPAWPLLAAETRESLARLETEIWAARAQRHPREPQPQVELARRLSARGDWSQAINAWEETLGRCDDRTPPELAGEAWLKLAESRQRLRRFDAAREAYRKVVELADLATASNAGDAHRAAEDGNPGPGALRGPERLSDNGSCGERGSRFGRDADNHHEHRQTGGERAALSLAWAARRQAACEQLARLGESIRPRTTG